MNLKPPSILLPVAGAALGFAVGGRKNYWAIGAGVAVGMLGNALLNLAAVKNDAAAQLGADVGMGPRVPGASFARELWGSVDGDSPKPVYPAAFLQAEKVASAAPSLPSPQPAAAPQQTSADPAAVAAWLAQQAQNAQQNAPQATMGHVSGPAPAPAPARRAVPAAHPSGRRASR